MVFKVPTVMKTPPELKAGALFPCPMCLRLVIVNSDDTTVRKPSAKELEERADEIAWKAAVVRSLMPVIEIAQEAHELQDRIIKSVPHN